MPGVEDYLVQLDQARRKRGLPEFDDETLKVLGEKMAHPEVLQAFASGQLTADVVIEQAIEAGQVAAQRRGAGAPLGQALPQ